MPPTLETSPVTYSWPEIRVRAQGFSARWASERRERAEKDTFWNELLAIFGVDRRQVARFEHVVTRYSTNRIGFIDVLWPGRILVEHKSAGVDLDAAMQQALDYLPLMDDADVPEILVLCNFGEFLVRSLDTGSQIRFSLEHLYEHVKVFGVLAGRDNRHFENEVDVNLAATGLLARFHDALADAGYGDHHRRVLLTRVLFCLFADDAGVWPGGLFEDYLRLRTRTDGTDLGSQLNFLFQLLDTPPAQRGNRVPEEAQDLTYINGGLFAETLPISYCDAEMRAALLAASRFNWSAISPAIFGSIFQDVMDPIERRKIGAHYTNEKNILRTIKPLFLDDLTAELESATTAPTLRAFRDRLATQTFFDPACGCGNFLVIAYREVRRLETRCLVKLREKEAGARGRRRTAGAGQLAVDVTLESKVTVGQFYGIELEEFPCKIAETAMHLADHLANLELSAALGQVTARFPIQDTAHILSANACDTDWSTVLAPERCSYMLGNPPFVGMAWMTDPQKDDRARAFAALRVPGARTGRLDYVASWYAKAISYAQGQPIRAAFVSTNSIAQGDQARALGPLLLASGIRLNFAHRTFEWQSEARGAAHVHVVIVGFSHATAPARPLRLFDYPTLRAEPTETAARNINIYLVDAPNIIPAKRDQPLRPGMPPASKGSQPTDGKHLTVTAADYAAVMTDPLAAKYVKPYWGSKELLQGKERWCLWLVGADPADLASSPALRSRLALVRAARLRSDTLSVQKDADTPSLFTQIRQPVGDYLAMPEVSSSTRTYIPVTLLPVDTIASNKLICWPSSDLRLFALLSSRAFTTWQGSVGGRLKSDYSISPDLSYCTFPWPDDTTPRRRKLEVLGQGVLDARSAHPAATLVELYHPLAMPVDLVRAHRALDAEVDKQVTGRVRSGQGQRLSALLQAYQDLTQAAELELELGAAPAAKRRPGRSA